MYSAPLPPLLIQRHAAVLETNIAAIPAILVVEHGHERRQIFVSENARQTGGSAVGRYESP